jgi:hypothetical protein
MTEEHALDPLPTRPSRLLAALLGAVNLLAYLALAVLLWSLDGDPWGVLAGAFFFTIASPFALLAGAWLGARQARSGRRRSPWAFARPGQVAIVLLLVPVTGGVGELLRSHGFFARAPAPPAWHSAASIEELDEALKAPQASRRLEAADELATRAHPRAAELILPLLNDENAEVRRSAVADLARLGGRAAVLPLIRALEDPSAEVRQQAVVSLGLLGDERATPSLIALLPDPRRGAAAAEALANIGSAAAVPPLIDALALMNAQGRRSDADRTAACLRRLTGQDFGGDPVRWRQWWKSAGRR